LYSSFQLAKKYLHYYLVSSNGKGHGIHSPFVFDFVTKVLNDKDTPGCFNQIETVRKKLKNSGQIIEVEDFGAGSAVLEKRRRKISGIARTSLKQKKYSQLLYRIVHYYKPPTILELGTSLGITSAYLATANPLGKVITCEGAENIAAIAKENFKQLGLNKIELITGNFDETLPSLLPQLQKIDFAFIDGNHRKIPTLNYFQQILDYSHDTTLLVFDDIHWSEEMESAWETIMNNPKVTLTMDLFFIGIVCINNNIKVKQHFTIRF
jgi:predicted O-methyltransferase YrrM